MADSAASTFNDNGEPWVLPPGTTDPQDRSAAQRKHPGKQFHSDVTIHFKNLSRYEWVSKVKPLYWTPWTPFSLFYQAAREKFSNVGFDKFYRLKDVNGIIRPATMTLVIGCPGSGKSTYLRCLSNSISASTGLVAYNGRSFAQAKSERCDLKKMTQYVDQTDLHIPALTVHETITFAHQMSSVEYDPQRVQDAITLLGLEECVDTYIGDGQMIRGVSGGQKHRVSTGEVLVSDSSVLFLDEFSNGLDSSTAEDIARGLRTWCHDTNASVVASLQQPTPQLFDLFDRLVVLREGQVVYDGPTCDTLPFFQGMGFLCPLDVDTADNLIDCLSQPRTVIYRQRLMALQNKKNKHKKNKPTQQRRDDDNEDAMFLVHDYGTRAIDTSKPIQTSYGEIIPSPQPCVTTEQMREYYESSPQYREIREELDRVLPDSESSTPAPSGSHQFKPLMPTEHSHRMFGLGYRMSMILMMYYFVARQNKLFVRGFRTLVPRWINCIVMSLILGSVYYNLKTADYLQRLASLVIVTAQVSFGQMIELPGAVLAANVAQKHLSSRYFPPWVLIFGMFLLVLPSVLIDTIIYCSVMYWMVGMYPGPLQFWTYFAIVFLQSMNIAAVFRSLGMTGNQYLAQTLAGPFIGISLTFGGFFQSLNSTPHWLWELVFISPFSWSVRALGVNEFSSPRYDAVVGIANSAGETVYQRLGNLYMKQMDMWTEYQWIPAGMGYLFVTTLSLLVAQCFYVAKHQYEQSRGTTRFVAEEDLAADHDEAEADLANGHNDMSPAQQDEQIKLQVTAAAYQQTIQERETSRSQQSNAGPRVDSVTVPSASQTSTSGTVLPTLRDHVPFTPAWLSFSNVKYTVKVKKEGQTVDRVLLAGVNGYAQPGKMLALMGASGAGKTTLLDVLSFRKNTGVVEGNISINGQTATQTLAATLCGYIEQFDTLFAYETVFSTLLFAARLNLPPSVPDKVKCRIVEEIMDTLELTSIKDHIIGNQRIPGLSPSQSKRVNIGLELATNPSVIFLDEPTTGLDSRSAQVVMRAVKRIAKSGRAIICTIHQPSAELFYLFDRLVLLGSGGHQIYFGDLGFRSQTFVSYLSSCPGVAPIPIHVNPASWMLHQLGVGVASQRGDVEGNFRQENASKETSNPRFYVKDEEGWENFSSQHRTVMRFEKIYLQSTHYERLRHRLNVLENIPQGEHALASELQQQTDTALTSSTIAAPVQHGDVELSATSQTVLPTSTVKIVIPEHPNVFIKFLLLLNRNWFSYWRNLAVIIPRFVTTLAITILFGLIYLDIKVTDLASATATLSGITRTSSFGAIVSCMSVFPLIFELRPVMIREKHSNYYNPGTWALCAIVLELFWCALNTTVMQIPSYFMLGLRSDFVIWLSNWFATYLMTVVYASIIMAMSAASPVQPLAQLLSGTCFSLLNMFSGISITLKQMHFWKWMFQLVPTSHLTAAMVMPQFVNNYHLITIISGTTTQVLSVKDYIHQYLGFRYDIYGEAIGIVVAECFALQFLAFLATSFFDHSRR